MVQSSVRLAGLALALALIPGAAGAQSKVEVPFSLNPFSSSTPAVQPAKLSPPQKEAVQGINKYFNAIRTMSGSFVQFGPDGQRTEGQFYLAKPGKIRFQYAKPATLEIVADATDVVVKDRKNQTQDLYPLSKTPLRFLLADQLDLTSEATVTRVSVEPDLVSIVLEQSTVFGDGRLTMVFDRKTSDLKQWTVTDAQGYDTSVAIYNTVVNQPVDEKLFKIDRTRILQ
ncbi:outer-membrane lipoprotein carrier protein LolA [Prosthecomicrobium sp. N25]|uniref:outer-membrane lipoprotein carrier protein LolA n=1 Tax=Prosthecomicrobium sp. N25 TaxID=3129254 RepID=UPI0030774E77